MKKYKANTTISVSVSLPKGGSTRVSFSALSDGSSVFYTGDKEIQWALEHHYKYGKLFRLEEEIPDTKQKVRTIKCSTSDTQTIGTPILNSEEENIENSAEKEGLILKEVKVTDLEDAKDYLAENFGVVRTKLKKEETIKETALAYGITFSFV